MIRIKKGAKALRQEGNDFLMAVIRGTFPTAVITGCPTVEIEGMELRFGGLQYAPMRSLLLASGYYELSLFGVPLFIHARYIAFEQGEEVTDDDSV